MKTELQNKAWACLPKGAREEIRKDYNSYESSYSVDYNDGYAKALEIYFGEHNLTSDTEPEEMLMVERRKVVEWYSSLSNEHKIYAKGTTDRISLCARLAMIEELFGDKCLPDKIQDTGFGGMNLTPPACKLDVKPEQPSVQVEPKFHKGDKVWLKHEWCRLVDPCLFTTKDIGDVDIDGVITYSVEESDKIFRETMLEPYTEPETKETMEKNRCEKCGARIVMCDYPPEEKELNLCELLKGCEGEKFFSISVGEIIFKAIYNNDDTFKIRTIRKDAVGNEYNVNFHSDGRRNKSGLPDLYPSEDLLKKYPLEPKKAWQIWAEVRKPKRWRAKEGGVFYRIEIDGEVFPRTESFTFGDNKLFEQFNYFRTEEEAQQAAEAVRETLEKFRKEHTPKADK